MFEVVSSPRYLGWAIRAYRPHGVVVAIVFEAGDQRPSFESVQVLVLPSCIKAIKVLNVKGLWRK